jgi:hypothetical protein
MMMHGPANVKTNLTNPPSQRRIFTRALATDTNPTDSPVHRHQKTYCTKTVSYCILLRHSYPILSGTQRAVARTAAIIVLQMAL